jgi:hypothetical protein
LHEESSFWQVRPKLPKLGIHSSQAVELPDGSVILVEGKIIDSLDMKDNLNIINHENGLSYHKTFKEVKYFHVSF